jgi:predicted AlkP superfamily pyrophosphatase or phosphodiesterase
MTPLSADRVVYLDAYVDQSAVDVTEWHGMLAVAPNDGDSRSLYRRLHGRHPALAVYSRDTMPARLHYRGTLRIAPVIGIPRDGWAVTTHARLADKPLDRATHGYEPSTPSMGALFVAAGPTLRAGITVPAFENIHVYNFMCRVLGIAPAPNDGDDRVARWTLRR